MRDGDAALERLCDPAAKVSAHYLVEEDGTVVSLVPDELRAWHAGVSWWRGRANLNDVSIGIEIVNPGHEWGYRDFLPEQMAAVADLARKLIDRWRIAPWNVVAHSDIAPTRKEDPGERFDWESLARRGIGTWPPVNSTGSPTSGDPRPLLRRIGYPLEDEGSPLERSIIAFQRRFLPGSLGCGSDAATLHRLAEVAALYPPWMPTR